MERAGLLKVISAHEDDKLVGLIALLTTVIPHYNAPVSHVESFYVFPEFRKGGTAIKLFTEAEKMARSLGSSGMFASSAIGSRMESFIEHHAGFRESHRSFFKGFNNA